MFLKEDVEQILEASADALTALSGSNIVLAGAGGFLGRYFVEVIQSFNRNNDIKISLLGVDNYASSTKPPETLATSDKNVTLQMMDICAPIDYTGLITPDFIVNAGGIASPHYYRAKPLATVDVSTTGSRNLLGWAHDCGAKYTFFSSSEIYGDPDPTKVPIRECYRGNVSTLGPRACYDESKRLGETLCYIYSKNFETKTSIIRPFNVYGPGMMKFDYRVMPNFARQILSNQNLTVYGNGLQTRTFCYITDAMRGFFDIIAFGESPEAYNVGCTSPEVTMLDLAQLFLTAAPSSKSQIILENYPNTYPGDEPLRRCPDISKLKELTGFSADVDLADGVNKYLAWANKNF